MADTYAVALCKGLAAHLMACGIGTYSPSGTYAATDMPITFNTLPATPHALAIAITPYLDDPWPGTTAVVQQFVQIRTRATVNPLDGLAVTDRLRDLLHRARYVPLGAVTVSNIILESFAPLGPDSNGRYEWTQNFRLTGNRWKGSV